MAERIGVILLNLGGPSGPEEVAPFLKALFSDREIIRLPGGPLLQPLFAKLITAIRKKKVIANYDLIGGGSPILPLTTAQAEGLEVRLRERGLDVTVGIAMRYTKPRAADALTAMVEAGVDRLVVLTLYPQYSKATTGSSLADLDRTMTEMGIDLPVTVIDRYPTHPGYLEAMAANIRAAIQACPVKARKSVVLLFSAHSLPQRFIDEGDPYLAETVKTVEALRKLVPENQPWRLGFQSRSGPVKWIGPDTEDVITELGVAGQKDVIVVPVSFVSDHIETLYEVDLLYGDQARKLGIKGYRRAESLNDSPVFIAALADLVEEALL